MTTPHPDLRRAERGVALVMALFIALIVSGIALGAILMTSNSKLISRFHVKEAAMTAAADGGLEVGRSTLNGRRGLLPVDGYVTLENDAAVLDAAGAAIPGFRRSTYAARTGNRSGQFGQFASVISEVRDPRGAVAVRRVELTEESFAKYALFVDRWENTNTRFGCGSLLAGPVHINADLLIWSTAQCPPPPVFRGEVTTTGTIREASYGVFEQGYQEQVARIEMPTPAELAQMRSLATLGNMVVPGGTVGTGVTQPEARLEFLVVDLDGDGDADANEGFFRVYRGTTFNNETREWLNADGSPSGPPAASPLRNSLNCGDWAGGRFLAASLHRDADNMLVPGHADYDATLVAHAHAVAVGGNANDNRDASLAQVANRVCYLGGDPALSGGAFDPESDNGLGAWVEFPGPTPAALTALGRADADYLWPISRALNPNFKGVIYVDGSIAISGAVRGRVTLVTTGNVVQTDDVTYSQQPADCFDELRDVLGVVTPQNFVIADNGINSPTQVDGDWVPGFDETREEFFHGVVLTLGSRMAENPGSGATAAEPCQGLSQGRGCYESLGGVIQRDMQAIGSTSGHGWKGRTTYDVCAGRNPPPYFPTTGVYKRNSYYEIDPVGFDPAEWFDANQPEF